MPEREMLEMAARAAGIVSLRWGIDKPERQINGEGQFIGATWNPLTDDGDAFRLAVALHMRVKYHEALGQTLVWLSGSEREFQVNVEDCGRDPLAATRLAITRAAASIGEKMRDDTALRNLNAASEAMGEEL